MSVKSYSLFLAVPCVISLFVDSDPATAATAAGVVTAVKLWSVTHKAGNLWGGGPRACSNIHDVRLVIWGQTQKIMFKLHTEMRPKSHTYLRVPEYSTLTVWCTNFHTLIMYWRFGITGSNKVNVTVTSSLSSTTISNAKSQADVKDSKELTTHKPRAHHNVNAWSKMCRQS